MPHPCVLISLCVTITALIIIFNPRYLRQFHVIALAEVAPWTAVNVGELRCGTSMKGES